MNIKTNVVKLAVGASVVSAAIAAYAFSPAKEQQDIKPVVEPVYVMAPFTFIEFEKKDQAIFETSNKEFTLEVDFVSDEYRDSYGVQGGSFDAAEVKEIKDIHVYNEDGEVLNAYVDRLDVQEIVNSIEQELRKP
ncbi:hypothetical protein [Acinetobacter gyllenbergii]|uniref:hypothetical protein n=1 Tax=Acinetobacter gyllenbergii TaxID=134534 RepID=UPI000806BC18|nr:hypothetical protein [Acinetobacter gyllenbergii]OBY75927.1 hypothetical protein NG55_04460 [Acinetobacter gyllenbergii]